MNLPVDDAKMLAAARATRHPGLTVVVLCDEYEVIALDDLPPVVVPSNPALRLTLDTLDDVAAFMRNRHALGDL